MKIESVSALDSTTLTVTGQALEELAKADITVEGNTVSNYTVAADGKSATVLLDKSLGLDVATKVTVKGTDFTVTYKVVATSVSLKDGATYDDNTADQFVKINIGGREVTASELLTAGYDVKFEAFDSKSATTPASIFVGTPADESSTGELKADLKSLITYVSEVKMYISK